jgi:RNA polymerase sigma-70 factor (ECF subfamily)
MSLATLMRTPAEEEEKSIFALARGDAAARERALHALYERHGPEVLSFLVRFLGDHALAEDVLQESFVAVHASFDRYDPERPFKPWLHQIVRNHALMALRARKKASGLVEKKARAGAEGSLDATREAMSREAVSETRGALEELGDETRALLVERYGLGRKLTDLADAWSVSERTIRNRLHDAAEQFARAVVARRAKGGPK